MCVDQEEPPCQDLANDLPGQEAHKTHDIATKSADGFYKSGHHLLRVVRIYKYIIQ